MADEVAVQRSPLPYVMVRVDVLRDPDLAPQAKLLYGVLVTYAGFDTGECWVTRATLAGHLGLSTDSVDRWVKVLVEKRLLEVIRRRKPGGENLPNVWRITDGFRTEGGSRADAAPLAASVRRGGRAGAAQTKPSNQGSPSESRARARGALAGDAIRVFDAFWTAFPRKTGKAAAVKAWAKAVDGGVQPATILAAAEALAEWHKRAGTEVQFIPHPTTWLNQGRWEDELPPLPAAARRTSSIPAWS